MVSPKIHVTRDKFAAIIDPDRLGITGLAADTIQSRNDVFALVAEGIVEFGGQLTGDLTADAVVLTSTARVKGLVHGRKLTVEGQLHGKVNALQVSIKTGARVMADVAYDRLDIASGAQVEGAYSRVDAGKFKL